MEDARIIRFFSIDPMHPKYPFNSDYAFAENNLVSGVDLEGAELLPVNTGLFRMNADKGKSMVVTLNDRNVPNAFKGSNGKPLFTPASVRVTPQGQLQLGSIPAMIPSNDLPKSPDWAWQQGDPPRDGDGGYIGTNIETNQAFADKAGAVGSARQEINAWVTTFRDNVPIWNAYEKLSGDIQAFDRAVNAVNSSPLTVGFVNALNAKIHADVTNFVYDGVLPPLDFKNPVKSIDYQLQISSIGINIMNEKGIRVREETRSTIKSLGEMRKSWEVSNNKNKTSEKSQIFKTE